ncbi:MAG: radical SAM protein [Oligoflexia bacterium]|nr:radical SAM protein [Oligoflexia bacterium]
MAEGCEQLLNTFINIGNFLFMTQKLILDGSKILWHNDRLQAWIRGERFAPITIDMALSRNCNYKCEYCYGQLQENSRKKITFEVMRNFFDDCAEMGVRGVSFVSDGESTMNPYLAEIITYGNKQGIALALGSNGLLLNRNLLEKILPAITYLRFNISAGERNRYAQIHGVPPHYFDKVIENIQTALAIKKQLGLTVTIGMQMVLLPQYKDQIIPLSLLAQKLSPDYLVIKHCTDDEEGSLGIDYSKYQELIPTLKEAETFSTSQFTVSVKWSKIQAEGKRSYEQCYGVPFHLQISGSGLVAPCGSFFHEKYKQYHIGNFVEQRFKDLVFSDRYWEIINTLASPHFNAKSMCACLCLQHKTNEVLDRYKKGEIELSIPQGNPPMHLNFI